MVVAYRDLSGNNPTHHFLDRPTLRSAPAVEFGDLLDGTSADIDFPKMARAIYQGAAVALDIEVVDRRGNSTVFADVPPGSILDVQASGTKVAGTTCTALIPLY